MFNDSITIYNKVFDVETRLDKYQRTVLHGVFWDETGAINRIASGVRDIDEVTIVIPFTMEASRSFLSPDDFDKETNKKDYFTLKPEDRIVRGVHEFEVGEKISDLDKLFDAHVIVSVDVKDFGTSMLRHWEVGAK